MANREMLRYLTEPLREVALHHLHPDEDIVTAIYVDHHTHLVRERAYWFTWVRRVHLPARAFVLTPERAMILDDPTDPVTSTANRKYLVASCLLNDVVLFESRSHLLDCAVTLVIAASNGPERITLEYNGVARDHFLAAVAYMRAVIDHQHLPSSTQADEVYARERATAKKSWYSVLMGLSMRQEYEIMQGLVAGECIQEWLTIPALDESTWWERLGIGAHEQPEALLVRTDRQILLVKETKRIIRGHDTYGSDTWIMPLKHLHEAKVTSEQENLYLQIALKHLEVTEVVCLPLPPERAKQALALVTEAQ
jgi:hypothetical protein